MNFIDATLTKEGNNTYLVFGANKITVVPEKAEKVKDYIGKEVTFGVRPENIYAAATYPKANPNNTVHSTVRVFEMLGAEVFVYVTVEGVDVTVREAPGTVVKPGDDVDICFDVDKIHIFDKETQVTICN